METIRAFCHWTATHRHVAYDLIRAYIGVSLFVRGILFLADAAGTVEPLLASAQPTFRSVAIIHYVGLAHVAGGVLLALGLLTRLAALVQIPILFVAVFFIHLQEGLLTTGQSLELSALVLVLLVAFFGFGAGRWSLDHYVFRRPEPAAPPARAVTKPASRRRPAPARAPVKTDFNPDSVSESEHEAESECGCGHDITHPRVRPEVRYGVLGALYFVAGITAPVKEVVFRCMECGKVIARSRDRTVREAYRYRRDA